jgi:hypothetical protein
MKLSVFLSLALFAATIIKLFVATSLGLIGVYYVKNARQLACVIYEISQRLKPPFSWPFPSRIYASKFFVCMIWLGGFGALLIGAIVLVTIVFDWIHQA